VIALIPARGGSKRVIGKNIRSFCGHPLIAYTIAQAWASGVFDGIYVSTENDETAWIARKYGAEVIDRPIEYARDDSPDCEWVLSALSKVATTELYAILRPTSPFRTVGTIVHGVSLLQQNSLFDSVRAIRKVSEHPCKMWKYHKFVDTTGRITPLLPIPHVGVRPYDLPTQSFDGVWVQTGGLQVHRVLDGIDISGDHIAGIMVGGYEAVDINTEEDYHYAQYLVETGKVRLIDADVHSIQ